MHNLRIGSLQWVVGAYCSVLGAILLVAPHDFDNSVIAAFQNRSWIFGTGLLITGVAMFCVAILVPSRASTLAGHLCSGILLIMLGSITWRADNILGAVDNLVLGGGTILAGWCYHPARVTPPARYNLATLLLGIASLINGGILLLMPVAVQASVPAYTWQYLPVFGVLFLLGAGLLFFVLFPLQLFSQTPQSWPGIPWLVYLAAGLIWLVFLVSVVRPFASWVDIAFYAMVAVYLLVYPWLVTFSVFPFRTSLHARITLLLGIAVAFPLISTVSWISFRELTDATNRSLTHLQTESKNLATGISYNVELHRSGVLALARIPDLADLDQDILATEMSAYREAYPDMLYLAMYDQNGQLVAQTSEPALFAGGADPIFELVRRALQPVSDVLASPLNRQAILGYGVPILDGQGELKRVLTCFFETGKMTSAISIQGSANPTPDYLIDESGHSLIQSDGGGPAVFQDMSNQPLISGVLAAKNPFGTLVIDLQKDTVLAAYARMPDLGWYVVSTEKASQAFSAVYAGRETAFGLLILSLGIAVLGGWWIAGKLTAPLEALARAADALAAGDSGVPLPTTRIQEIGGLSRAFGAMRDRLVARTAERIQAENELRQAKVQLEDRVRERTTELETELDERKRVEQTLNETRNRFHLVIDSSPIMVFTTDHELRYTWVYHPWPGFLPSDLLHRRDDEILPLSSVFEMVTLKQSVLASGHGARREVNIQTGDGNFVYDMSVEPVLGDRGEIIGLSGAAMDITEQKRLENEMRRSVEHIEVQRRLIQLREQERVQIARDLHDGPLQELIGLNFLVSSAEAMVSEGSAGDSIHAIRDSLQEMIESLRTFAGELRPPALAKFGLAKAIRSFVEGFQKKHAGLEIDLDLVDDAQTIPEQSRLVLYRILQESVNNIFRHAQASQVKICLQLTPTEVILEVQDNGSGFEMPEDWLELARQGHLGLIGMHERAETAGGSLSLRTAPGEGTLVHIQIPLDVGPNPPE
jgi:signal transduction histidine kinase